MNITREVAEIIRRAVVFARENHYEFVTPEMILLLICGNKEFQAAFTQCGGDVSGLIESLKEYIQKYVDKDEANEPELSVGSNFLLSFAQQSAANSGRDEIDLTHLVHALWNLQGSYAVYFLEQQEIEEADLLRELMLELEEDRDYELPTGTEDEPEFDAASEQTGWQLYAPCLNDTLMDVNPLIGREDELERTIQILCRKDKNNPLHIGEPGVGKTAITYGLVQRINENRVPEPLIGSRVFGLDLGGMVAGTQYRGDFEKRLKKGLK